MAIDNVYFIPLLTKVNVPNKRGKEFKNRNVFFKPTILPKNEQTISLFLPKNYDRILIGIEYWYVHKTINHKYF